MKIPGDALFFWIHEQYGNSEHYFSSSAEKPLVHSLSFYDRSHSVTGHIVSVPDVSILHNVAHSSDNIYLYIGDATVPSDWGGELIAVRGGVSPEKGYNTVIEIIEKFDAWESALDQAVKDYFSFQSIIRSCDYLVQDPIALADTQFHYIAYSKKLAMENGYEEAYVDAHDYVPAEEITNLTADPDYPELAKKRDVFRYTSSADCLYKNIFFQNEYVGRLAIPYCRQEHKNRYYAWVLEVLAQYIERLYENTQTFWGRKKQNNSIKGLINEFLSGMPVQIAPLERELRLLEYNDGDRYCLTQLVSHYTVDREKLNQGLSLHIENQWPGSTCVIHNEKFYILTNLTFYGIRSPRPFSQNLAVLLRESVLTAGISRTFTSFSHLQCAALQTDEALEIGPQKDPMFWYFRFDDYCFDYLLLKGIGSFLPEHVCSQVIGTLREYDSRNGTDLTKTLRSYISNRFNAASTAKELFLARSSFLKRLERIETLTAIRWDDTREIAHIMLSFELLDLWEKRDPEKTR